MCKYVCSQCPKQSWSLPQLATYIVNHKNVIKPQSRKINLNSHKTVLITKTHFTYPSFDLNKRLTSSLCEAIDQPVAFIPVLNKKYGCAYVYARMFGKLVAKKSTKQPHLNSVSFTKQ